MPRPVRHIWPGVLLPGEEPMTDKIALWLGLFIAAAVAADLILFGNQHIVYLGRKLFELTDWMAFWR